MKQMCAQLDVLKKIRKKGKVNGYDVDLAEAQAKDYLAIKTEQARQGGMIEAIFNRLNSPVEQERLDGQKWNLLTSIAKNKSAWIILIIFLIAIALAGERIVSIIDKLI